MTTREGEPPPDVAEVYSEDGYYAVIPEWVLDADISAQAVRLYAVLRRYADQRTMHAHPSRKTLADRLKVKSTRTVDAALGELKGIGALRTFARFTKDGDPDSNGYVLHRTPRFEAPDVPLARGMAADCTTPPPAADCTTPLAADCERVVQQTAHEPQPLNYSQGNHSQNSLPSGESTREDVEQPTLVDAPAKPARPKRRQQVPEDWKPSESLAAWTSQNAPGMPRSEVARFRDFHRSKGNVFADIDAAWRTWVGRWVDRRTTSASPGRSGAYRNPDRTAAIRPQQEQDDPLAAWEA